ncbi:hypothetical protein TcasGA2_TC005196 [Tribolium castaneum]|uniref:Uncharacterized protein n=1 Tax=Tribolium castaneum TaxID=7070 RepID=D7EKZ8_TRICA|nr:hypothetical protein TcasGA2_TC005196 [Tribolium castaneum]
MQVENKDIIEIREKLLAIQAQAAANITKRQEYDKDRYDSFHRHVDFSVGEQVKMFVPRRKIGKSPKLMCRWFGPYTVVKKVSDVNYELELGTKKKPKREIVHVSRILKYHDPWTSPTQGPKKEDPFQNIRWHERCSLRSEDNVVDLNYTHKKMFDIEKGIEWDEDVVGYKFQSHGAYTARYENTDEIRIPLQEDLCTLPCDRLILIEGQLVKTDATTNKTVPATETKCVNNDVAFLFSEIRYEVSGVTVITNTKPGITTTMKNLASLNQSESLKLTMSGWDLNEKATKPIDGYFQACIPLNRL